MIVNKIYKVGEQMTLIEAMVNMRYGRYVTHPKWKDGDSYDYFIAYNKYNKCIDLVDVLRVDSMDEEYSVDVYEFDLDDMLDEKWIIYND